MKPGQKTFATITAVHDYGVDIEAEGVRGFIQPIEVSWNERAKPQDVVIPGAVIEVLVTAVSSERFSASLKRAGPADDPWQHPGPPATGAVVRGRVTADMGWGFEVALEGKLCGVLPDSGLPRKHHVGDEITVRIDSVDPELRKITLGVLGCANT
jgi:ribosomal protein S1